MAPEKRERGHRWRKLTQSLERQYAGRNGGIIHCHLCGGITDRNAAKGHPDALTWDHIQPRSVRPDIELHPDNLAPACALCNSMRRDRPLEECIGNAELKVLWQRQRLINVQRQNLRRDKAATGGTALTTQAQRGQANTATPRIYQRGIDYPPFSPMTGEPRSDTCTVRSYFNPRFAPWGNEPPYDEWTGKRRPGVEWPIGSGQYGV
ncbi:MAG: hypothetical protein EOP32_11990 [Rhodococcus sp. (in: high G+C Gram-positive bacteria)]|nr:MAG: hypothetical protein EOP32_11990 [Rhodococcus sp. (in: high G+C Gram-positive bacteria)]